MSTNDVTQTMSYKLLHSQAMCRPLGMIPSEASLDPQKPTYLSVYIQCLSPVEKTCCAILSKYATDINSISKEQLAVIKKIQSLTQGIYASQLNAFSLLLPELILNPEDFSKNATVIDLNKDIRNTRQAINLLNEGLLDVFSLTERMIKTKSDIPEEIFCKTFKNIESLIIDLNKQKQTSLSDRKKEVINLFITLLDDYKNLFPLIFSPIAGLISDKNSSFIPCFNIGICNQILGSLNFLDSGIKKQLKLLRAEEKKLKERKSKKIQNALAAEYLSCIKKFYAEAISIVSQIERFSKELNSLFDYKKLLENEQGAKKGDINSLSKLLEASNEIMSHFLCLDTAYKGPAQFRLLQSHINDLSNSAHIKKSEFNEITEKWKSDLENFNYNIQIPIYLVKLHFMRLLKPIHLDLEFTADMYKELDLEDAYSPYVRMIDILMSDMANHILSLKKLNENERFLLLDQLNIFLGFLSKIAETYSLKGMAPETSLLGVEFSNFLKDLPTRSIASFSFNFAFPFLSKLKDYQDREQLQSVNLKLPMLHFYPYLFSIFTGDQKKFNDIEKNFFLKNIQLIQSIIKLLINQHPSYTPKSHPILITHHTRVLEFLKILQSILSTNAKTEQDIEAIALKLYQAFGGAFPKLDVSAFDNQLAKGKELSEQEVQEIHSEYSYLVAGLENIFLYPLLKLGEFVSLTAVPPSSKLSKKTPLLTPLSSPLILKSSKEEEEEDFEADSSPAPQLIEVSSEEAAAALKVKVARLSTTPKATALDDENKGRQYLMSHAKENLELQLQNLTELLASPVLFPTAQAEALEKTIALALEATLLYLSGLHGVQDPNNNNTKIISLLSKDKTLWQHKLDVIASLIPNLELSEEEVSFLKSFSPMLSAIFRPSQNQTEPRISGLFTLKENEILQTALKESAQALRLIQNLLGGVSPLTISDKVKLPTASQPATGLMETTALMSKCKTLANKLNLLTNLSMPSLNFGLAQKKIHKEQLTYMVQDLPYHLSIVEKLAGAFSKDKPLPSWVFNQFLAHAGLLIEKSIKVPGLCLPKASVSQDHPNTHRMFDLVGKKPLYCNHNLENNLLLLEGEKLGFTQEEHQAISDLSHFAQFTRYPGLQTGKLPTLLAKVHMLSELSTGFMSDTLKAQMKALLSDEERSKRWTKERCEKEILRIQKEEFLPLAKTLLGAAEKLLAFATGI